MRFPLLAFALALLGACAAPAVPDQSYFRMPAVAAAATMRTTPVSTLPIVVEPFRANGVYNDQSILYALKPEGSIKAYHYQLWDEAPSLLLQRRLVATLRARRSAELVTDRLPAALPAMRIGGSVEQFERVRGGSGWSARVRLELRVERDTQAAPLLLKTYAAEVAAKSDTIESSVRAFAQAIDACHAEFANDLTSLSAP
ncbi:MAG: membrane integrity-associated transporter subunit PqiC [Xanthomonadales bacterium]|nr:membrane integrity-associated transporter subunit PqiC [Xanthomonadales bacterium]